MESLRDSCALFLKDDYEPWYKHGKLTTFGKPLIVDQSDYNTLQIFFDDNIIQSDKCIVDVRDLISGKQLPLEETKGNPNGTYISQYLCQVDIIQAALKKQYFIDHINECEKLRLEQQDLIERGGPEQVVEEKEKDNEW